jgi:hypothetical protein
VTHKDRPESNPSQAYEIVVRGELGQRWSKWLDGLAHTVEVRESNPEGTVLKIEVRDQAALRGLLNQLWDLNLTLVRVLPIHPQADKEGDR